MSSHHHHTHSGPSIETHVPIPGSSSAAQSLASAEAAHQNQRSGEGGPLSTSGAKKKKKRTGKKRKTRRQSFAAPSEQTEDNDENERPELPQIAESQPSQSNFYRLNRAHESNESLDSQTLLDHRTHESSTRHRRSSVLQSSYATRPQAVNRHSRQSHGEGLTSSTSDAIDHAAPRDSPADVPSDPDDTDDRTPLIGSGSKSTPTSKKPAGYGGLGSDDRYDLRKRRPSAASSGHSNPKGSRIPHQMSTLSSKSMNSDYDINNPPSVPGSPRLGSDFDDVLLPEFSGTSPTEGARHGREARDAIINIDTDNSAITYGKSPRSPGADWQTPNRNRRQTTGSDMVEDVCIPYDDMTEIGQEDYLQQHEDDQQRVRRSRKRAWPDLSALEDWSRQEKEQLSTENFGAKKVNEPVLVGGRLRPQKGTWRREAEEAPFRWTYFNEELDSSLRSQSITGLQQLGLSFRELFIPDMPELEDSSSDEEDENVDVGPKDRAVTPTNGVSRSGTRQSSILEHRGFDKQPGNGTAAGSSGDQTPSKTHSGERQRQKRYGPRPVFWLDVLQPTYEEMRVISRAFGIHKLTAEDIMEQEAREKVELFRNYYFVNYRTFEQDEKSEDYMDPVNMYFVVFKGGVISFHFSQMPHPPSVRRRIRQLAEHQYTDSDWISYAIIDNITDAYAPLIEQIEAEVDDIDDEILRLHNKDAGGGSNESGGKPSKMSEKNDGEKGATTEATASAANDMRRDMLVRVGECRKRVMGLYRLLGNKADVIKGLAKRCNENWQVAPTSDVGLYLGDIQDHIVTMTANLTHYENILSRAHSNYLAQISIKMNERAEQTADVLGKLTVLGTIVLPMNIITGLWGMNTKVPGQDVDSLTWFWCLTGGLFAFGLVCYSIAKKLYGIV